MNKFFININVALLFLAQVFLACFCGTDHDGVTFCFSFNNSYFKIDFPVGLGYWLMCFLSPIQKSEAFVNQSSNNRWCNGAFVYVYN